MTPHRKFETSTELGEAAAAVIAEGIIASAAASRPYLLGCPGGRTPRVIYDALGRLCADQTIDCSHVVIVMMDDYLDSASSTPAPVPFEAHNSCRRFAEFEIRQVISRGLPAAMAIAPESIWLPDPTHPSRYDERITEAGGVDLFVVASGASDGHVAFCGPGSDLDGTTAVVALAASTRADNTVTFPEFTSVNEVPTHGVTVGLGTIRNLSRAVLMVLHGPDKQESARRLDAGSRHDPSWPATFIHECTNAEIWTDSTASPPEMEREESQWHK